MTSDPIDRETDDPRSAESDDRSKRYAGGPPTPARTDDEREADACIETARRGAEEDLHEYQLLGDDVTVLPVSYRPQPGDTISVWGEPWKISKIQQVKASLDPDAGPAGWLLDCRWFDPEAIGVGSGGIVGHGAWTSRTVHPVEWAEVRLVEPAPDSPYRDIASLFEERRSLLDEVRAWRECICSIEWSAICPTHVPPI